MSNLNETDRDMVYRELLEWMQTKAEKAARERSQ